MDSINQPVMDIHVLIQDYVSRDMFVVKRARAHTHAHTHRHKRTLQLSTARMLVVARTCMCIDARVLMCERSIRMHAPRRKGVGR